jgi:hypothetical protein
VWSASVPDPVHRIGTRVEARPIELWTLGQAIRYVHDRDVTWARSAPPFPSKFNSTPDAREAIFDLWREAAARTIHPIRDYSEVHPSQWDFEARLILNFQEKQGERTGDFGPFLAEVERLMGDMLFPAVELTRVFPRRTPFQLAVEPVELSEPAKADGLTAPAKKDKKDPLPTRPEVQPRRSLVVETAAALLRIYPGRRGSDSYDVMLDKLARDGLIVGRTTVVRALQKLGPNWRIEPH